MVNLFNDLFFLLVSKTEPSAMCSLCSPGNTIALLYKTTVHIPVDLCPGLHASAPPSSSRGSFSVTFAVYICVYLGLTPQ